ncbi:unnamed protein product [Orchesella dallaii]|uniref:Uncharacterized protein n=1 Tax=Orchesella dallaii TaxID=48710 RepID=A0ABP1S9L8_9HEXA
MANLNSNTTIPLNQFGSLPNLRIRSNCISPTVEVPRLLPQSAPNAKNSSQSTVIIEISEDEENGTETGGETNPTEILGTLRMHYHDVTSWRPSYLQAFFKITNYTGFTPYRFTMHNQPEKFGKMKFWIVTVLVLTSFVLAATGSLIGFPNVHGKGWSMSSLLDYRSKEIEEFFVSTNLNQSIEILYASEKNHDITTVSMGILGCLMKFVGTAADQFDRYAILFSILILKQCVDEFNFDEMPVCATEGMIITPRLIGKQIRMRYNDLKGISKSINDVLEEMIELFLLDSLLTIADFVTKFRDWLTSEPGAEKSGMGTEDVQTILNELATNPIGVGRDSLYTNKGFLIGYFGIAIGYFFSTVETRASTCDCS